MCSSRAGWVGLVLPLLISSLSMGARAELVVVTTRGDSEALAYAETASATGDADSVTWLSLRIHRGPAAVVAALPEGASLEPAHDAWLVALERTASPNVLLPRGATDCGKSPSFAHVSWPRSRGTGAVELTLTTAEDVITSLADHGLEPSLNVPAASRYVVWAWPANAEELTTRTLRVSGAAMPLSFLPARGWPVLVNRLSRGPMRSAEERGTENLVVTFVAGKPGTDYIARLQRWLERERAPLLESRAAGTVFGWSILDDTVSLPPLVRSYARSAADQSDDVDVESCAAQLQAFQHGGASTAPACTAATDAAMALSAAGPQPVLQRWVVSGDAPLDADAFFEGGEPSPAVLRARAVDASACPEMVVDPPIVLPPSGTGGGTPSGKGPDRGTEDDQFAVESHRDESCSSAPGREPHYQETSSTTVYCAGDSSSSARDDSCSGDSASSSGDDGCSSDSASSSGDDSCASDSAAGSGDDSCSSDGASDSGDDSCSGGTDRGYDGETCTGRAAPATEKGTSQTALTARGRRPQRLRLSLWSLALAAALLPIRRRKRAGVQ